MPHITIFDKPPNAFLPSVKSAKTGIGSDEDLLMPGQRWRDAVKHAFAHMAWGSNDNGSAALQASSADAVILTAGAYNISVRHDHMQLSATALICGDSFWPASVESDCNCGILTE